MKGLQTFSFYFFHVFYVFIGFKNQFLTERLLHLFFTERLSERAAVGSDGA